MTSNAFELCMIWAKGLLWNLLIAMLCVEREAVEMDQMELNVSRLKGC